MEYPSELGSRPEPFRSHIFCQKGPLEVFAPPQAIAGGGLGTLEKSPCYAEFKSREYFLGALVDISASVFFNFSARLKKFAASRGKKL